MSQLRLAELNSYVPVVAYTGSLDDDEYLTQFQVLFGGERGLRVKELKQTMFLSGSPANLYACCVALVLCTLGLN